MATTTNTASPTTPLPPPPPPPPPPPGATPPPIVYHPLIGTFHPPGFYHPPPPPPPGFTPPPPPRSLPPPTYTAIPNFPPNFPNFPPNFNSLTLCSTIPNQLSTSVPNLDSITPITIPTPIKLTHTNFLTWKAQILPLINGYNLYKFLHEPAPQPTKQTAEGLIELNQDFHPWHRQDQLLLGWLRASLSESIQAQVVSCNTSASLWTTLQQQFSSNSRARLIDLKRQLQSASKSSSSCTDFLQHIRRIADELSFIGAPPSDDDLVLALLNGLGS